MATLVAVQVLFTYAPVMHEVFGSAALDGSAWLRVLTVAVTAYLLVELFKTLLRMAGTRPVAARRSESP
ncbi:cation transporting ATPase C-terminal domain-containing protein [Thermomonospora cellulosilytica]|uniref:Cation-transporting P-type ATPase C-terminal domain-containing protein n=1 Tax=Thermomonospora cellulosilytica TaxID=1411118 RepID=A0A7W3MVS7_9ACTN|nr:cation transporting ATPase C-terminal domain-containing protein [Thermomonospora cellulosilytica]MBA9002796.1 hypothetical protein [Thermomonospora cellulosilytica]